MEKMTKKEKFKKFVDDHHETIAKAIVYTTIIAGSVAIIVRAVSKEQDRIDAIDRHNEWVDEENDWLDEKLADGTRDAYILHDKTYMFIPKDTEKEFVEDRLNDIRIKN